MHALPRCRSSASARPALRRKARRPSRSTRTLTLDEALTIAEKTSERVAIAAAGVSRADAGRALARSDGLPQLNGGASYDRTLRSEFEGLFDTDPGTDPAAATKSISRICPFGQANVYRVGLSFSQLLYAGGRIRAQDGRPHCATTARC